MPFRHFKGSVDDGGAGRLVSSGTAFVGSIPAELQLVTVYAAVLTKTAKEPDAAEALIRFLTSPNAVPAIERAGLTPRPQR
jgi:molybdate transport system substrate-binding protein